ncbi:MAG: hypothetical protein IPK21_07690 [Haliscomenobacter sp.]|nr:hypothetical protein [Haliscomenobacter sp.]
MNEFDTEDNQLKLEIALLFGRRSLGKKHDLALLGYAINGSVTESWETIQNDEDFDQAQSSPIDTEEARDSRLLS